MTLELLALVRQHGLYLAHTSRLSVYVYTVYLYTFMHYIYIMLPFYTFSTQPREATDREGGALVHIDEEISIPSSSESSQDEEAQGGGASTSDIVWMKVKPITSLL